MTNPDVIPLWLAVPAGLFIYGTWLYFAVRDHRERMAVIPRGEARLGHPVVDPATVRLQGAEDRRTDHHEREQRAKDHAQQAQRDPEQQGGRNHVHAHEGISR
jgi:hypothetical protein